MADFSHLVLRRVAPDDWQAYRDFYKGLKNPHMFSQFLKGRDLDDPATYTNLFDHTIRKDSFVMFGLWDGDKMIGQSSIDFIHEEGKTIALFAGSEIADDYRGQRLVDRFYEARRRYLEDTNFDGDIITTIQPGNESSIKAAERNGFRNTSRLDSHGYMVFALDERVPQPQQQQQTRHMGSGNFGDGAPARPNALPARIPSHANVIA